MLNVFTQVFDCFMALNRKLMHRTSLTYVSWHPDEKLCDKLNLWDRQRDIHEGLKSDGEMVAVRLRTSDG